MQFTLQHVFRGRIGLEHTEQDQFVFGICVECTVVTITASTYISMEGAYRVNWLNKA